MRAFLAAVRQQMVDDFKARVTGVAIDAGEVREKIEARIIAISQLRAGLADESRAVGVERRRGCAMAYWIGRRMSGMPS